MKKSTFIGNLVAWVVVAAACIAFLAWYHSVDPSIVESLLGSSPLVQMGVVIASPVLLFAMGALIGLLLLWFKNILMGRTAKVVCRIVSILVLVTLALVVVPTFAPETSSSFLGISVVVVYVTRVAPIMIMFFGFLYALGCAGVDRSKKGPFAKYLPSDDEDGRAA